MQWTWAAILAGVTFGCATPRPAPPAPTARPAAAAPFPASFLARLPLDTGPGGPAGPPLDRSSPPRRVRDPSLAANRGAIAGVVRDADGRPVGGAEVILRATDLPAAVRTLSAPDGSFELRDVPLGKACVSVIRGDLGASLESVVEPGVRVYLVLEVGDGKPVPIEQRRARVRDQGTGSWPGT